jgi:hypothetical protein
MAPHWGPQIGVNDLQWSFDSRKVAVSVTLAIAESSSEARFVVDVDAGVYHRMPPGLGRYLTPVMAMPGIPGAAPITPSREKPKEADVRGCLWIPGTRRLLLALNDPRPTYGLDAIGWSAQYGAWVVWDTDSGDILPVRGLPGSSASPAHGYPLGRLNERFGKWSGRYLSLYEDYPHIYRMH